MSVDMIRIARRVLEENGFEPDAPHEIEPLGNRDPAAGAADLRSLPWSSIDNEESKDLDQIEWAERQKDGSIRILLGIANVAAYVHRDTPVDKHAAKNTTSLYTGVKTFHMLPKALSTQRTSLLQDEERLAIVTEMFVREDGNVDDSRTQIHAARVVNRAKLIYEKVGAWLEGDRSAAPRDPVVAEQLELQAEATKRLRARRIEAGALELETIEAQTVAKDGKVVDLRILHKNRARDLIEDLMIAANVATARYLESHGYSSIRRVVQAPSRWPRIVEIARAHGTELPAEPNVKALGDFVSAQRREHPETFPDLSLTIVKLLGAGEYKLQRAKDPDTGHFGLAVSDYMHSTAPNRRFADLVTQRVLLAAYAKQRSEYSDDDLQQIAVHCTERENAANKVERTMRKVAAAELLSHRIGQTFDAIVTGNKPHATYARLFRPPAEGRIVQNEQGLDVGDKIKVRLVATEPEKGFIDFAMVSRRAPTSPPQNGD
ncbi:MAG TPA: RNB domain-containing ribonuclease [Kofleriaceae bacterium]|nr:RNB domain-containing ribonuclease [Kofleriaceae bacterium]